MKQIKLCMYLKEDGSLCGSPAMRRKRCCYYHHEQQLRERRREIALSRQSRQATAPDTPINPNEIKTLVLNMFGKKTLEDIYCLKPELRRLCEETEGGG